MAKIWLSFGLSKTARVAIISLLVPFLLYTEDSHVPLASVREAPPLQLEPLTAGGSYDPVLPPADVTDSSSVDVRVLKSQQQQGAIVSLRYAFGRVPGLDRTLEHPVALDAATKQWVHEEFANVAPTWLLIVFGTVKLCAYKWVAGAIFMHPELYLLSPAHWEVLLAPWTSVVHEKDGEAEPLRALDIGAGVGHVTQYYAPLFDQVVTTEVAWPYIKRLQERGYDAYQTEDVTPFYLGGQRNFDVVLALNVLDRHARPVQLLRQMGSMLRPGGAIVLSVPLPVTQHDSARYLPFLSRAPDSLGLSSPEALAETLTDGEDLFKGGVWEAAVSELVLTVLKPQGWRENTSTLHHNVIPT